MRVQGQETGKKVRVWGQEDRMRIETAGTRDVVLEDMKVSERGGQETTGRKVRLWG